MSESLAPVRNRLNAPFWLAGEADRLVLPHCVASGRAFWPPSPVSPFVTAGRVDWREVAPVGVVRGRVVYRRVFLKALEAATPFGVGLIELDAGPRLMAHLAHPDDPAAPRVGDRVRLVFQPIVLDGPAVPNLTHITPQGSTP
jgi:uncharacterized OB-fold protein